MANKKDRLKKFMAGVGSIFQRCIEAVTILLVIALAVIVVLAVGFRYAGSSLIWYDEVASVLLVWITYFGAALAAFRRNHLGFSGMALSLGENGRKIFFVLGEVVVYAVFIIMAWASWRVLEVMEGETLISLEWIPLTLTQSIVPLGCVLFVLAQIFSSPTAWARIKAGRDSEKEEIEREIQKHCQLDHKGREDSP